jgi:hypothetical protein
MTPGIISPLGLGFCLCQSINILPPHDTYWWVEQERFIYHLIILVEKFYYYDYLTFADNITQATDVMKVHISLACS